MFIRLRELVFAYKMLHLLGSPQGPSSSFASGCSFDPLLIFLVAGASVLFVIPLFSAFATASDFAPPPLDVPLEGPSSQKLTLEMAFPKDSPCVVAISSSKAVGWRDPSAEAKVPAPHGEPP